MATSGSFTIGGTSPDYATIQAWADSPTGNLTGVYEGKVRAGTYEEEVDINIGFTTTASNYMKLTYDTGAHHNGVYGDGVVITASRTQTADLLAIRDPYTRVIGLSFTAPMGGGRDGIKPHVGNCRIEECLGWNMQERLADFIQLEYTTADPTYISNCHSYQIGRAFLRINSGTVADGGDLYIYNCTGIECGTASYSADDSIVGISINGTPSTGRTIHAKNCYMDIITPLGWVTRTASEAAFQKESGTDSWGNSTNNASSDTSAPGTSPQTGLTLSTQVVTLPLTETIGDDDGASAFDYDCGEDRLQAHINKNAPTSTASDAQIEMNIVESPIHVRTTLQRMSLSAFPAAALVYGAQYRANSGTALTTKGNSRVVFAQMDRNWTSSATWNTYDGTNNWGTAGALATSDYIEASDFDLTSNGNAEWAANDMAANDAVYWPSNMFASWVKDAIDGSGASPAGVNYIDIAIYGQDMTADDPQSFLGHTEGTVANRPRWAITYHTSGNEPDWTPAVAGSLDGNGTDLSSDTDYAISTDVTGATRGTWDIGAFAVTAQTVTQDALITATWTPNDATIEQPVNAPTGMTVDTFGQNTIDVSWTDTNGGAYAPRMYIRTPAGSGAYDFVTELAAGTTTYQYTGLNPGTQYECAVAYRIP